MSIVIPREVWKPRYSNGFRIIGLKEWEAAGRELWLHHSVTNAPGPDATLEEDCAHMRLIEHIGQTNFGGGISYTYVSMPSGRLFEGHSLDRQGAHTSGRNNRARAICCAGNYDTRELFPRMPKSIAALLRELGATLDGGHRDVYPTACPGKHAYAQIANINRLATSGADLGTGGDAMSNWDEMSGFEEEGHEYSMKEIFVGSNRAALVGARATEELVGEAKKQTSALERIAEALEAREG